MRVTFVLPNAYFTGGSRMVFEYARRLPALGHAAEVVFPFVPYRFRETRAALAGLRGWAGGLKNNLLHGSRPPNQPVHGRLRMVPAIAAPFVPGGDAVVATAWPTARSVARLPKRCGTRCYLVQHREVDSGRADDVDATYRLPLFRIAGSAYTARLLVETLGIEADAVAPNGVAVDFWSAEPARARAGVLMPHAPPERKGAADGFAALAEVRRLRPEVPLRCFGRGRTADVPGFVEYHACPDDRALRALYASAAVFLFPSRYEGYGLPPLEAMATGCAVVSTRVGAVPEFLADREDGLLVEPRDVAGMARAVLALLGDDGLRARLGAGARARAHEHDLALSVRAFEGALMSALRRDGR